VPRARRNRWWDRLNAALQEAIKDPDFKANLAKLAAEPVSAERARPESPAQIPAIGDREVGGRSSKRPGNMQIEYV